MKLLFCYDGPIVKDNKENYYGTALNDEMFERYNCITDDLTIAIRVNRIENVENKYLKISKEKYKIVECPNLSSIKGLLFNKRTCHKILEEQIKNSDAIIIRLPSFIGNLAIKLAKKHKKKYLIEMVGCPWDALWNYSVRGKLIAPYMYFRTKKNVKEASYVLYVTSKFLQKRYPTKGKSINCSNVVLSDTYSKIEIKNKTNKNKKIATIAAIDVKYKGQQYVIKALNKLNKKGKCNYEYHIIGAGDNNFLFNLVEKYGLQDFVKFCGPISHDKIFKKLDEIDIYIQPSKQEGLPRALIEAMSRGCLCIGSNAGGIPELLDKKYIFKKGKARKIAEILESIDNNQYYIEGTKNINISKQYDKEVLTERRTKFYMEFNKNREMEIL